MEIGVYLNSHGITSLRTGSMRLVKVAVQDMRPVEVAQRAEELAYHSLWFSDHITMTETTESAHNAADPITGERAYPPNPNMLDALVLMGAVTASTKSIRVAPSILVSPYRHPLSDVRQLLTVEALGPGRLILAVGTGWLKEEFESLGVDYATRSEVTAECIDIYRAGMSDGPTSHSGEFFEFERLSMEPTPRAVPPIIFGGVTRRSARLAAKSCDGWFPTFTDPSAKPDRYDEQLDYLWAELDQSGRDPSTFKLAAVVTVRIIEGGLDGRARRFAEGSPEQVLEDLSLLGKRGFQTLVLQLNCESESVAEYWEQLEMVGVGVVPQARQLSNESRWGDAL